MPKEFFVYTDNHALSFLNRQEKLNHRHMKWIEFLQAYTFIIKHKKGVRNKVADAISGEELDNPRGSVRKHWHPCNEGYV